MKILITAAHADDIEFGVTGSVIRWISEGAQVAYCIITDGSAGSNDPDSVPEDLIATRQKEQIEAAKIAGVDDVRFLGFPDGVLESTLELRRAITRVIRDFKPNRVVFQDSTFFIDDDNGYLNHPDHIAAGTASAYAVFPSAETRPIFPELLAEGYEPHKVSEIYLYLCTNPNHYVDISDVMETKLNALKMHKSQSLNEEVMEMVRGWNRSIGEKADVEFAEEFRVLSLGD
jgi:LmbE family N-acetylglucosaminyl deacetylase